MKTETLDRLRSKIIKIDAMPAIPVILRPLLRCLDQPAEEVDMNRIVELVSCDKVDCRAVYSNGQFRAFYAQFSVRIGSLRGDEPGDVARPRFAFL